MAACALLHVGQCLLGKLPDGAGGYPLAPDRGDRRRDGRRGVTAILLLEPDDQSGIEQTRSHEVKALLHHRRAAGSSGAHLQPRFHEGTHLIDHHVVGQVDPFKGLHIGREYGLNVLGLHLGIRQGRSDRFANHFLLIDVLAAALVIGLAYSHYGYSITHVSTSS